ncbi:unnamed protein product, partial [Prunus brigantina]
SKFHFCCFIITTLLLFILFPLLSNASSSRNYNTETSFEFLAHLKGCQKGDKVEGIQNLKTYLKKFGYLNGQSNNDANFDDELESAIKTYQSLTTARPLEHGGLTVSQYSYFPRNAK